MDDEKLCEWCLEPIEGPSIEEDGEFYHLACWSDKDDSELTEVA